MVIRATDEKDYVFQYLSAIQAKAGLSPREVIVATEVVYKYMILRKAQGNLKTEKARKEFDPMKEWKRPNVLTEITSELGMSFQVFRNYMSSLKRKGFFENKKIKEDFIPSKGSTEIKIVYGY